MRLASPADSLISPHHRHAHRIETRNSERENRKLSLCHCTMSFTASIPNVVTLRENQSLKRRNGSDPNLSQSHASICDQTQLLLQKMAVLERKLVSLEKKLELERTQKLQLEAKVVRLEEENKVLQQSRVKAGQQLHSFAEMFYSTTDAVKVQTVSAVTPSGSPRQSVIEIGRTESESSYRMSTISV